MMEGLRQSRAKRQAFMAQQDVKENVTQEMQRTKDDIDDQLESVTDDVALIRKLMVVMERSIVCQEWGTAYRTASAINALAGSVSRRIEMCFAQADVINRLSEALRRSTAVLLLLVVLAACGSADDDHLAPVAVESVRVTAPPAPLAVVSKPAPVSQWQKRKRDDDD